jgi:hypothetical protein
VLVNTNTTLPVNRSLATAAVALAAAAGAVLAAPAPHASAQAVVITDPADDLRGVSQDFSGDIVKVRTTHGRHNVRVAVRHDDRGLTDVTLAWIDTDPRNPGPEYQVGAYAETEGVSVKRVDDWQRQGGTAVRCPGAAASFGFDQDGGAVLMTVPRSCLGRPDTVRVSAATEPDYPFKRIDWAPGKKKFGPSLVSGPKG